MPCDQIISQPVTLDNIQSVPLLISGLEALGWEIHSQNLEKRSFRFMTDDGISGSFVNGTATFQSSRGVDEDDMRRTMAQAYGRAAVEAAAKRTGFQIRFKNTEKTSLRMTRKY